MVNTADIQGRVHSVETFGTHDGPGIRFVAFLQGCPRACLYCHNPDARPFQAGEMITAGELVGRISRYVTYFESSGGGVTLSGGEPLCQPQFAAAVLELCRRRSIHTAVDTSGVPWTDDVAQAMSATDLAILDIKSFRPDTHSRLAGGELSEVLAFSEHLTERGTQTWLRYVVVPGYNDQPEEFESLGRYAAGHPNVRLVQLLPYHTLGVHKWKALGLPYALEGLQPPGPEMMHRARAIVTGYFDRVED